MDVFWTEERIEALYMELEARGRKARKRRVIVEYGEVSVGPAGGEAPSAFPQLSPDLPEGGLA